MFPGDRRRLPAADPAQGDHRRAGEPSPAEADAAVALAAQLSATYRQRSQPTQVVVAPLAGDQATVDTPSIPMERVFIVKEGPDNGLSLVGSGGIPQLRISGPANKLKNAARLLTNGALNLAVSTNVVTGDLRSDPRFPGNATTLAALGRRVITAAGAAPQVTIYLDQTKFGHSIQGVRVHVQGSTRRSRVPSGPGHRQHRRRAPRIVARGTQRGHRPLDRRSRSAGGTLHRPHRGGEHHGERRPL